MNAVSTKEASGSAANAREAGTAMRSTSDPSSSSFKTLLEPVIQPNLSHQHKHIWWIDQQKDKTRTETHADAPDVHDENKEPRHPRPAGRCRHWQQILHFVLLLTAAVCHPRDRNCHVLIFSRVRRSSTAVLHAHQPAAGTEKCVT
jgi:hypothetical protein